MKWALLSTSHAQGYGQTSLRPLPLASPTHRNVTKGAHSTSRSITTAAKTRICSWKTDGARCTAATIRPAATTCADHEDAWRVAHGLRAKAAPAPTGSQVGNVPDAAIKHQVLK